MLCTIERQNQLCPQRKQGATVARKKLMINHIVKYYIQLFVHIHEEMGWLVNEKKVMRLSEW